MPTQSITLPFEDNCFWSKVNFNGPIPEHHPELGPCWIWTGSLDSWGYGQVSRHGKAHKTNRYSYEMTHGPIPAGMLICHHCDTPACVNPTHFFLGTNKSNMHDAMEKGRHVTRRYQMTDILPRGADHWTAREPGTSPVIGTIGEENPGAKLNEDAVRDIRRRYAVGDIAQSVLAKEFGVSQTVISHCLRRTTWQHVEDDLDAPPAQPRIIPKRVGTATGHAKVTEGDVREIRRRHTAGGVTLTDLAKEYEPTTSAIWHIVHRKNWTHLKD